MELINNLLKMPPKTAGKKPSKASYKQSLDELVGESEMAPGEAAQIVSDKLQKEKIEELDEKFYQVDSALIQ